MTPSSLHSFFDRLLESQQENSQIKGKGVNCNTKLALNV